MSRFALLFAAFATAVAGCGGGDAPETTSATAGWVMQLGGTIRLPGKTKDLKTTGELPKDGFQIERIILNETKVRDEDLQQLASLKSLRSLSLYRTNISDKAIDHVVAISNLAELELSYTRVTDEGLGKLKSMPHLEKLFLYGMTGTVTDAGVSALQSAKPALKIIR